MLHAMTKDGQDDTTWDVMDRRLADFLSRSCLAIAAASASPSPLFTSSSPQTETETEDGVALSNLEAHGEKTDEAEAEAAELCGESESEAYVAAALRKEAQKRDAVLCTGENMCNT